MGIFGNRLPLSFEFANGRARWSGFTKRGKCDYCKRSDAAVYGAQHLSGEGNTPAEALLNLAERFEAIAQAARHAAQSPKIKYDTMYIEPNPELPPPPRASNAQTEDISTMKQLPGPNEIMRR